MQGIIKIFILFSHIFMGHPQPISQEKLERILYERKATIQELNTLAQKNFLRPHNSERMSDQAIEHYKRVCSGFTTEQKQQILSSFYNLRYISAIYPQKKTTPDIILIQGSTVPNMRKRLMFLAKNVEQGLVNLKPETQIVFLVGERELFVTETREVLVNTSPYVKDPHWQIPSLLPHDEREASKLVWAQLKLPLALRQIKPFFLDAKKQNNAKRAQTEGCVQFWLKDVNLSTKKKVLMISNNPYINYQKAVTELEIYKAGYDQLLEVEGVGESYNIDEEDIDITIGLLLDTLARVLYVKNQFEQIKHK